MQVNQSGVTCLIVTLDESGAVNNVRFETEPELPALARITGGGWRVTGSSGEVMRSSQGLTLHCDILLANNLQINWQDGGSNKWHINKIVDAAFCYDHPDYTPSRPPLRPTHSSGWMWEN